MPETGDIRGEPFGPDRGLLMRIRSIKPEFWRSGDITSLPVEDRLLFIGLWSYVDDNGVGRDDEALILADLFPHDWLEDPRETLARVSRGLQNLFDRGLVTRYSVDGRRFLYVTGWEQHQRIDHPNKARYPGPDQAYREPRDTLATSSRKPRETLAPGTGEQGNRGTESSSPIGTSRSAAADEDPDGLDTRARTFNFDGHRVRAELTKVLGEFPDADTVMRVATGVLKKAKRPADDPTAYIVGAIRKSEFEIQKLAHGETA
jgi:hypothetical protein